MKILVACEESQVVTRELRRLGHEAYSCDVQPCSGWHPEWHIQGDVLKLIYPDVWLCSLDPEIPDEMYGTFQTVDGKIHNLPPRWDMIIAFPPCTYLTNAGNRHFSIEKYGAKAIERMKRRIEAANFFMKIANADCDRIAIENPVGYMNSHYRKADQTIHPYFFAKSESDKINYQVKRTCLWLKGLAKLERTSNLPQPLPKYVDKTEKAKARYFTEAMSGSNRKRQKLRSKTFPGIAKAMAEQWAGAAKTSAM